VYVEGGYSDSNSVRYAARILNAIGIGHIRGFFTNDTHLNWTINEVRWATAISELTHGAHFIVNTADNGQGPLLNPHPQTQGIENLCNPPGRGLGPTDTTQTGYALADAWLWMHPPGNSSGCGGGPSNGTFWLQKAVGLAERANQRLGPSSPSRPY
jgi:endoglucanase